MDAATILHLISNGRTCTPMHTALSKALRASPKVSHFGKGLITYNSWNPMESFRDSW